MAIDNALPWFPLTPAYIDKYHDDVLKYLRDSMEGEKDVLKNDKSFITTTSLLMQRAEELRASYLSRPLLGAQSADRKELEKDARIIAATALYCSVFSVGDTAGYMSLLCYLLSLFSPELSGYLSLIALRCIKTFSVTGVGYNMEDIIRFNVPELVKKMENATMDESSEAGWLQKHGTFKVTSDGIAMYPMNRMFVNMKEKVLRQGMAVENGQIQVFQDKKSGKTFSFDADRFLADCSEVNEDAESVALKTYEEGDRLTVKVKGVAYDTIYVESIDPSYEIVSGQVGIIGGANVRGVYMTDFASTGMKTK